ncbi:hypothetical protein NE237_011994 [Protea cynaroides]|uniref:J domain-containing protein n=1 Tax=Protea cynaroides TaxID=273540 RepID=A0A9Q0GYA2_9MAGN|nr:hypothetical protein NE237_011994 [Protea cynaroides]
MECNKEEAVRAKEIAEKKMQSKDFVGARKIALKAQQLYPELDNISQMLTVCEVHCSAEQKILHSEMDWYGILQITQTADEASIKKQYRKLALLLHPDKNNFAGAEAAFKLIGEAQRVLTDQQKRNIYDMKCKHSVRSAAPRRAQQPANINSFVRKQPGNQNNFMNTSSQQFTGLHQQQPQNLPSFPNGQQTFWTICPFCSIRYQYYRNILNRALRCQSCTKPFVAYDLDAQGPTAGANCGQSASAQQKEIPGQGAKVGSQGTVGNPPGVGTRRTFGTGTQGQQYFPATGSTSNVGRDFKSTGKEDGNVDMGVGEEAKGRPKNQEKPVELKPPGNMGKKRGRELDEESSESFDKESSTDMEEDGAHLPEQNIGVAGARYPRRSSRQKNNVTYKEDLSDDDGAFSSPPKRSRESGSFRATEEQNKDDASEGGLPKIFRPSTSDAVSDVEKDNPLEENLPNGKNENEMRKENGKEADAVDDKEGRSKLGGHSKSIESPKTMPNPEYYDYPDPDFSNFDQLRELDKFAVDQIWALYDTIDAMPRFYARIRKVYSPGFNVRITWLEPIPDQNKIAWIEEDLPCACGSFKHGKTENTQDQLMFSHVILWERGNSRGSYKIYPRKGETWALFKGWDIKWSSDPENHQKYEFEFVEVISDYSEDSGISVVYLGRMKGFVSLFRQITKEGIHSFQIPTNELLRFSHRIPSFRMTGTEREDVPEGSYELDPASLPTDVEVFAHTEDVKMDNGSKHSCPKFSKYNGKLTMESVVPNTQQNRSEPRDEYGLETRNSEESSQNPMELNETLKKFSQANANQCAYEKTQKHLNNVKNGCFDGFAEAGVSTCQDDKERHRAVNASTSDNLLEDLNSSPASSSSEPDEIPEPEFYEFVTDRTSYKLRPGQIWALYSDHDAMPKFYGRIMKIKPEPDFKVWVTWLENCSLPEGSIEWTNEDMPVSCGVFKLGDTTDEYDSTGPFSHQLKAGLIGNSRYDIHPRKGEVWALYKNWEAEWTVANLPGCKYDLVEILECNNLVTKVKILELVHGKTVYKAAKERTLEIPHTELLRFSHQVPAFPLTEEKRGILRGCWELDPASLPFP